MSPASPPARVGDEAESSVDIQYVLMLPVVGRNIQLPDQDIEESVKRLEYALALNDAKTIAERLSAMEKRLGPIHVIASMLRDVLVPLAMSALSVSLAWVSWNGTEARKSEAETALSKANEKLADAAKELNKAKEALSASAERITVTRSAEYHRLFQQALAPGTGQEARVAALAGVCVQEVDKELSRSAKLVLSSLVVGCDHACRGENVQLCKDACHQLRCITGRPIDDEEQKKCQVESFCSM